MHKSGSLTRFLRTESAGNWEIKQTSLILQNKPWHVYLHTQKHYHKSSEESLPAQVEEQPAFALGEQEGQGISGPSVTSVFFQTHPLTRMASTLCSIMISSSHESWPKGQEEDNNMYVHMCTYMSALNKSSLQSEKFKTLFVMETFYKFYLGVHACLHREG